MKKKTLIKMYLILVSFGIFSLANAQVYNPNFFKKIGNGIHFIVSSWEFGSETNKIAKGWFSDLYATNLEANTANIATLQISSSIDPGPLVVAQSTNPTIRFKTDTDSGIGWLSDNKISLMTNDASQLTIDSAGKVGIGNTSPSQALDVVGTGKISTGLITPKVYPASDSTTAFQINKADGTTNVLNVDTTNGRVGIGTTAPGAQLALSKADSSGLTDFLVNPTTKTSGNFLDLQINGSSKYSVDYRGVGTMAGVYIGGNGLDVQSVNQTLYFVSRDYSGAINRTAIQMGYGTYSTTAGNTTPVWLKPTYNQVASTASNTDFLISRTETSLGSGAQYFIRGQAGAAGTTDEFWVTNTGGAFFNGNVGIGTTAPGYKLDVNGNARISGSGTISSLYMGDTSLAISDYYIQPLSSAANVSVSMKSKGNGGFNFDYNTGGESAFIFYGGGTSPLFRINAGGGGYITGGNVGIGTTGPGAKLHIFSTGTTPAINSNTVAVFERSGANTNTIGISLIGGTSGSSVIRLGDTDDEDIGEIRYDHTSNYLSFTTNTSEWMRITSGGNVGIGTTAPGAKLEINGGMRLNTATAKPTCDASARGTFWVVQGGAGVADTVETCIKNAADSYVWQTLY